MNHPRLTNGATANPRTTRADGRSQRGRIIVLGDQRLIESVAGVTHRPTTFAHHLYDVIGELVQAGVLDAPDAIVASVKALGVKTAPFVEAVRRIDPGVELIAIVEEHSGSMESTAGFDCCLPVPLDSESFERALQGDHAESPSRGAAGKARQSEPSGGTEERVAESPLGDVDLVAALLRQPDEVEALALRIIEQETGWTNLRIDRDAPRAAVSAEICCGRDGGSGREISCGHLVASEEIARSNVHNGPSVEQLEPWADWLAHWLHLSRSMSLLREQAQTDQLTGAYNRRYFDQHLAQALDDARTQRQCVSVLLFDIDDFKKYNDKYGHAAGDEILVETVKLLRSVIRPNDRVCRIGGDEFVVIFHDPQGQRERGSSHPDDIQQIARRFQQQICQHRFPKLSAEARGTLTISGGLSTFPWDGTDVTSLLEQADRNALASKRSGKNAITFGPDPENARQDADSQR